jgi:hypothetical protein
MWVSDGTFAGTRRVADVAVLGGSLPLGFRQLGSQLFFTATTNEFGRELYAMPVDVLTDADLDGLRDADERACGTNPFVADTDGDGFADGVEVAHGSDPLDAQSVPPAAPIPVGAAWLYAAIAVGLLASARRTLRAARSAK